MSAAVAFNVRIYIYNKFRKGIPLITSKGESDEINNQKNFEMPVTLFFPHPRMTH
jgi:hypothetical protein